MSIQTKLTKQELIRVNFILIYSKNWLRFSTALMIFLLLVCIAGSFISNINFSLPIVFFSIMGLYTPLLIYISAAINIKPGNRVLETIYYEFEKDYLSVSGESFKTQLSWEKIFQVKESKNWLFIMQNKQAANVIPKRNVSANQLSELKKILEQHKVKNNL